MTGSGKGDGGFLDRWSRRKLAGSADEEEGRSGPSGPLGAVGGSIDQPAGTAPSCDPTPETPEDEAAILERLGLANPDTLVKGDDFAAFMRAGVPGHIRRRALRRLWVSDPVLANLDNLVDHGEDYTDAATVVAGMKTTYQVGRGMLCALLDDEPADAVGAAGDTEAAALGDASPAPAGAPVTADGAPSAVSGSGAIPGSSELVTRGELDDHRQAPDATADPSAPTEPSQAPRMHAATPRRAAMRFTFDG